MSTTHKVVLIKKHKDDKTGYLKLRTTKDRNSTYTSLKYKVQVSNWNADKQYVKSREPNADEINEKIQEVLAEAQYSTVKKKKKRSSKSLIKYAERIVKAVSQEGTKRGKRNALNKLKQYLKSIDRDDITYAEVDNLFAKGYYGYLLKNTSNGTANEYFTIFKYFVKQVEESGLHTYKNNPFKGIKRVRKKTTYEVMTDDELERFFNYTPEKRTYLQVQQAFGFMIHAAGMRVSDLVNLKWKNFKKINDNFYIEYYTEKTSHKMKTKLTLDALKFMMVFIEDYDKTALSTFKKFENKQSRLRKKLEEYRQELDELELVSFTSMKHTPTQEIFETFHKKMQEAVKKEERQIILKQQINGIERDLEFNKDFLKNTLGDQILKIKEAHGNDYALPFLRGTEGTYDEAHNVKSKINQKLEIIQKYCKIKTNVRNHQARHVFAQRLFEAGANLHNISLALGHSSLEITENYREKLVTDDTLDVVEEFSRIKSF